MRRTLLMLLIGTVSLLALWPMLTHAATRTANPVNLVSQCQAMQNGDTLVLGAGTYGGGSCVFTDDDNQHNVTVQVAPGASVVFDNVCFGTDGANGVHFTGQAGTWRITNTEDSCGQAVSLFDVHDVVVEYLEIDHIDGQGFLGNCDRCTFRHVNVHHIAMTDSGQPYCHIYNPCTGNPCENTSGTKCHSWYMGGADHLIEDSISHHVDGSIIHGASDVALHGITVRRNQFHDTIGQNIWLLRSPQNWKIYNNLLGASGLNGGFGNIHVTGANGLIANNTLYGGGQALGIRVEGSNQQVINNIITGNWSDGNIEVLSGSGHTFTTNLCESSGFGCTVVGNPGFVGAANGDFHIGLANSPANNGSNLSASFTTDLEGLARPPTGAWTMGSYQFGAGCVPSSCPTGACCNGSCCTPNPDPGTIVADYPFDAGAGTTVTDFTTYNNVGTWTECGGNACWTPGITGAFAGNFNGTRAVQVTDTTGLHPTAGIALVARIRLTGTGLGGCDVVSIGDSATLRVKPNGSLEGFIYTGGSWQFAFSSGVNLLSGTNRLISLSYNGTDLRTYVDGAQVGFQAVTGPISYTLPNLQIGRHGNAGTSHTCTAVIDHVRIMDGPCDAGCQANFFNETVPVVDMSIAHTGWYSTGVVGGASEIARDAPLLNWLITTPLALRFALRKNNPGSVTEYFPPVCIVDTGAGFPPWSAAVALTNSFGALGVRYYADTAITQGQATSVLLPTDGATPVAGKILKNPIDTNAVDGYDAAQRVTLAQGQQADVQIQLEFGSPLVGGNRVQCRLTRENGVDLAGGYANLYPVTLQGITPPTSLRVGTTQQGGTLQ